MVYIANWCVCIKMSLSFSNTIIFNVSEFFPLEADAPGTSKLLHEVLIDLIDIDPQNVYTPDGTIAKESIFDFCKDYEKKIEKLGGLDLTLVEFGPSGNLAFNEPGSQINSSTRLMLLGSESRHNLQNYSTPMRQFLIVLLRWVFRLFWVRKK